MKTYIFLSLQLIASVILAIQLLIFPETVYDFQIRIISLVFIFQIPGILLEFKINRLRLAIAKVDKEIAELQASIALKEEQIRQKITQQEKP